MGPLISGKSGLVKYYSIWPDSIFDEPFLLFVFVGWFVLWILPMGFITIKLTSIWETFFYFFRSIEQSSILVFCLVGGIGTNTFHTSGVPNKKLVGSTQMCVSVCVCFFYWLLLDFLLVSRYSLKKRKSWREHEINFTGIFKSFPGEGGSLENGGTITFLKWPKGKKER